MLLRKHSRVTVYLKPDVPDYTGDLNKGKTSKMKINVGGHGCFQFPSSVIYKLRKEINISHIKSGNHS